MRKTFQPRAAVPSSVGLPGIADAHVGTLAELGLGGPSPLPLFKNELLPLF